MSRVEKLMEQVKLGGVVKDSNFWIKFVAIMQTV